MEISRDELQARFRDMSDAELLERASGSGLTDLAQEVMAAELAARGLAPARCDSEAPLDPALDPALGPLRICTRFLQPVDAEIFAARLTAEGIPAQVMDSDTLYANGLLFGSLTLGGVRVMVPESLMPQAQRVLAAFNAGEFAIDENFDPNAG